MINNPDNDPQALGLEVVDPDNDPAALGLEVVNADNDPAALGLETVDPDNDPQALGLELAEPDRPAARWGDAWNVPKELVKGASGAVVGAVREVPAGLKAAFTQGSKELAESEFQEGGLGAIEKEITRLERAKAGGEGVVKPVGVIEGLFGGSDAVRERMRSERAAGFKPEDEQRLADLYTQREAAKGRIAALESQAEAEMRAIMAARQERAKTFGPGEDASDLAQMANIGGNALGSVLVQAGMPAGMNMIYMANQQAVDAYVELRNRGLSHKSAQEKAMLDAGVAASMEAIPVEILKNAFAKSSRIIRSAAGLIMEGGQEVLQQLASNYVRDNELGQGLVQSGGAGAFAGAVLGALLPGRSGLNSSAIKQGLDWKADTAAKLTQGLRENYGISDPEVLAAVDRRMQEAQTPEELAALYADIDGLVAAERGEAGPVAEDIVAEAAAAEAQQQAPAAVPGPVATPAAEATTPAPAAQVPPVAPGEAAGAQAPAPEVIAGQPASEAPPVAPDGTLPPSVEPVVDQRPRRGNEGFRVRYRSTGETPLIDYIINEGGITPKPKDWQGGEYDGQPAMSELGGFAPVLFGKRSSTFNVDRVAQRAFDLGLISDPYPDTLWEAIRSEVQTYRDRRSTDKQERAEYADMQKQAKAHGKAFRQDVLAERKRRQAVPVADLKVGDQVSVGRVKLAVKDVDPDTGDVVLEDGKKYGVQVVANGQVLYVDRAKIKPLDDFDFAELDSFDAPADEAGAAADVPTVGNTEQPSVQSMDNPIRAVNPRTGQTEFIGQEEGGFRLVGQEAPDVSGQMQAARQAEAAAADADARQGRLFEESAQVAETPVDFPAKRREVVKTLGPAYAAEFDNRVRRDGGRAAVAWADTVLPAERDLGDGVITRRDDAGVWQIQSPDSPLDIPLRWDNPDHAEILREVDQLGNEQRVRAEVDRLQAGWKGVRVQVVRDVADLDPADAAEVRQKLGDSGAEGVFIAGRDGRRPTVVVFSNAVNPQRAVSVALHEAVGHAGLRGVMGQRFPRFLNQVFIGAPRQQIRQIATQYGLDLNTEAGRQEAAEEWMAQLAENRRDFPDMWARVVAGVRQWLRDMGIVTHMTDNDIAVMMYRARQYAEGRRGGADAVGAVVRASVANKISSINHERIAELGFTNDIREAGYITPDGKLIDLSGKKEGGQPGTRSYDHREAGGTNGMLEFMNQGNIRINGNAGQIDIMRKPTIQQLKVIERIIRDAGLENTFIDLSDGLGPFVDNQYKPARRNTMEPTERDSVRTIISKINSFYDGKDVGVRFSKPDSPQQRAAIIAARKRILDAEGKKLSAFTERMAKDQRVKIEQAKAALINPKSERVPQNLAELKESLSTMTAATLDKLITFSPNLDGPVEVRGQVVAGLALSEKLNRALAAGQDVSDIIGEGAQVGRVAAQVLRQMAEIKSTTSAGMASVVESLVQREGLSLTDAQRTKLLELADTRIKEQRAYEAAGKLHYDLMTDQSAAAYQYAEQRAYEAAVAFERYAAKVLPVRLGDQISAFIRGNLLTVKSHVLNIYGNLEWLALRSGAQAVGSMTDAVDTFIRRHVGAKDQQRSLLNPLTGTRAGLTGLREGLRESARVIKSGAPTVAGERVRTLHPITALEQWWTGQDIAVDPETGMVRKRDRALKLLEGLFGIAPEINLRLLSLADAPIRTARQRQVLYELGKARGLEGKALERFVQFPDSIPITLAKSGRALDKIRDRNVATVAERAAQEAVFQQDNMLSTMYEFALKGADVVSPQAGAAVRTLATTFFPYVKTPTNLLMTGIQFIMPELSLVSAAANFAMGNRRAGHMALGRAVMGASIMTAAQWLIRAGALLGDDESERARNLTNGLQTRNALNLTAIGRARSGQQMDTWQPGDRIIDLRSLGFLGMVFMSHANSFTKSALEAQEQDANFDPWAIFNPVVRMGSATVAATELPMLRGTANIIEVLQKNTESAWNRFVSQYSEVLGSVILPNNLAALNRVTWDYIPERTGDTPIDSFANVIKARLFMSDQMVLERDLFGRPIAQTPEGTRPLVYQMLDITRTRRFTSDPLYNAVYEVYRSTLDPDVIPSMPQRTLMNPLSRREEKLTMAEYERMLTIVGQARAYHMQKYLNDTRWPTATPEQRARALKLAFDKGREEGLEAYWVAKLKPGNIVRLAPPLQQIVAQATTR